MAEEIKKENMEETVETTETEDEGTVVGKHTKNYEEVREALQRTAEEIKQKSQEANEALAAGKGKLKLETPIKSSEGDIDELAYDFTELTGLEYTEAMDGDMNASQIFRITNRQALSLFAAAAAKQTPALDRRDILERIGMTDSVVASQLAILFFSASTRAGRMRISRR